jgi:hypothetical protein
MGAPEVSVDLLSQLPERFEPFRQKQQENLKKILPPSKCHVKQLFQVPVPFAAKDI